MIRVISLNNTEPLLVAAKRPVIIYVEVGGGKKEGGGGKAISDWPEAGASLIAKYILYIYILRGVHWPRWVKQLNSRAQTIYVKQ